MWDNFEHYFLFWFAAGVLKFMVVIVAIIVIVGMMIVMYLYHRWREQWQFRDSSEESRNVDDSIFHTLKEFSNGADLGLLLANYYRRTFDHRIFDRPQKDRRIRLMEARLKSLQKQGLIVYDFDVSKYRLTLT